MIRFIPITEKDIESLVPLAESIWKEHYYSCVGKELTDHVFREYQSEESVRSQLANGSRYYFAAMEDSGEKTGYFSIYPKEGKMYLSKLYLKKEFRGRGIAKEIIAFVKDEAKKQDLNEIFLNVNQANESSISAYKRMGFTIREPVEFYLGDFLCKDYIMEMRI